MKVAIPMTIADAMPAGPVARSMAQPRLARETGRAAVTGMAALIPWPPSRALRWLREACPRRRDTADAAFGPAPAAPVSGLGSTAGVSLRPASQGDPWVEHRVEHVHDHVDHHERGHEHERDALDHGEILGLGGEDQVGAEPVQAER